MIKSLTSLRGLFILFIFLHHAGVYPGGGTLGVAFFFVLSGFSMTLGYHDRIVEPFFNYKLYLTRRCIKFYPMHWIALIANIPYILMGTLHWWLIPLFFLNAALLQTLVPIQEVYFSYNAVSWFLADILFFTVAFPFVYRSLIETNTKNRLLIALAIASLYMLLILFVPENYRHAILYISPFIRIIDFVFGICLGILYLRIKNCVKETNSFFGEKQKHLITFVACFLIVLLIVESCFLGSYRLIAPLYWPLIAALILIVSIPKEGLLKVFENKVLLWIGVYSFTFFLTHRLVLRYTAMFITFESKVLYVVFCLVFTLSISYLVERYLLKNTTQWLTRKIQLSMTVRS